MTERLLTFLSVISTACFATGTDPDMVLSLATHFGSHHILILKDDQFSDSRVISRAARYLMNHRIFVTAVETKQISKLREWNFQITCKMLAVLNWDDFALPKFFVEVNREEDLARLIRSDPNGTQVFLKNIPFDSRFVLAEGNRSSGYSVKEIHGPTKWNFHLNRNGEISYFGIRERNPGRIVTVSSVGKEACKLSYKTRGIRGVVLCINFRLWSSVAQKLNFTTVYARDPQHEMSFPDRLKSYGVELSFLNLVLSSPSLNHYSFLWPTWKQGLDIYTAYRDQIFEWRTFIKPFEKKIWACVGGSIAILTVVALVVDRLLPSAVQVRTFDTVFLPFMAFCNQGVPDTPKNVTHRLFFVLALAIPTFLVPAYSAVLTSFVTVHVLRMPFTDLEGLVTAKNYKLGNVPPFDLLWVLKQDESPTIQKLLKNNLCHLSEMPKTEKEGAEKMCREKFSFVNVDASMLTVKPSCRFFKLNKQLLTVHAGMPIKKGSPYKLFIDRCLRTMRFSGLLEAIKDREAGYIFKMKPTREEEKESPVTFQNTVLLFSLVLSGVFASLAVLFFEVFTKKAKDSDLKKEKVNFFSTEKKLYVLNKKNTGANTYNSAKNVTALIFK